MRQSTSASVMQRWFRFFALALALCAATAKKHHHHTTAPTIAPTVTPTVAPTIAPTPDSTSAPTLAPTVESDETGAPTPESSAGTPTPAPSPASSSDTVAPTMPTTSQAPTPTTETATPTATPNDTTLEPTAVTPPDDDAPSAAPTAPPTAPPTASPTAASSDQEPDQNKGLSFLRILGKMIAWCIIIALSVLAFGAIMSNRYRIYFFLRGVGYTIKRLPCTRYILRKLRMGETQVDSSLNTIIFDNEMTEGLLLREDGAP